MQELIALRPLHNNLLEHNLIASTTLSSVNLDGESEEDVEDNRDAFKEKEEDFDDMGKQLDIACLTSTIVITIVTTVLMAITILSDYWEQITFPISTVNLILNISQSATNYSVESHCNEKILMIRKNGSDEAILVQMHAGLWSICLDLSDDEALFLDEIWPNHTMRQYGKCLSKLTQQQKFMENSPDAADSRVIRMQNLSVSCSLVCVIILIACLVVLWIGLVERQVPPVLIVSVLYVLAATFAIFSLEISRYRRSFTTLVFPPSAEDLDSFSQKGDPIRQLIPDYLLPTRRVQASWSIYLGWVGTGFCIFSALCVYGLSKLMRNSLFLI